MTKEKDELDEAIAEFKAAVKDEVKAIVSWLLPTLERILGGK